MTLPRLRLHAIVALDEKLGYSKDGDIPWISSRNKDVLDDRRWFAKMTLEYFNKPAILVMGGSTFRSLPSNFKLRGRKILVLSRQLTDGGHQMQDVEYLSLDQLIDRLRQDSSNVMVCGAYEILAEHISTLHYNIIEGNYDCDKTFPFDKLDRDCNMCAYSLDRTINALQCSIYSSEFDVSMRRKCIF